jgi:uncharacterized protein DUF4255
VASVNAIAAVTQTILGILSDAVPADFTGAQFEPLQIADFQKPKPVDEGISLLLYSVAASALQRNLHPRPEASGKQVRPPLPLDLHYLVTAWGKTAPQQQRLLGWCMRTLEDVGRLNPALLNHYGGPDIVFKSNEIVDLVYESIAMTDLSSLWDMLKPNAHVSVGYVARMIYIESEVEIPTGAPVQTRLYDMARDERGGP